MSACWVLLPLPWQAGLEMTWDAARVGCFPIGAVVTDSEGNILTRARNRIGETFEKDEHTLGSPLAHAELSALIQFPYGEIDPHTCTLYATMEPCPLCMGALYMSGIRHLNYACRDPYAGSTDMLGATPYLSRKPVKAVGLTNADLENVLAALHTEFTIRRGSEAAKQVIDVWQGTLPLAVQFGRELYKNNAVLGMREQGLNAGQAFDRLLRLLSDYQQRPSSK